MNEIEHKVDGAKGGFYVERDNEVIARLTYSSAGDERVSLDSTWVDESLRGQGIARKLVDAAVEFARKDGLSVIPRCSYVEAQMKEHEELRDVLDPSFQI